MTNYIEVNSHQSISWFLNRNSTREWYDIFKAMKVKKLKPRILHPARLLFKTWWRNQKLSRQAKVQRIQHHQTSFTINAKGTSAARKFKRRKRLSQNKSKAIKKMVIGSYISVITLNINGLNAAIKRQRLAEQVRTHAWVHFHLPYHSVWSPQIVCDYFILLS